MTPVASWSPVDYYHAHLACHRAWLNTQPQFVIPGLLDWLDTAPLTPCARKTVHATQQQEAAGTGGSVEPVSSRSHTPLWDGRLDSTTTRDGATLRLEKRAVPQEGA